MKHQFDIVQLSSHHLTTFDGLFVLASEISFDSIKHRVFPFNRTVNLHAPNWLFEKILYNYWHDYNLFAWILHKNIIVSHDLTDTRIVIEKCHDLDMTIIVKTNEIKRMIILL